MIIYKSMSNIQETFQEMASQVNNPPLGCNYEQIFCLQDNVQPIHESYKAS